jgi:hypothetical protein
VNQEPSYDIVQTAANGGHLEAVVKLVEAGASWRLPRGQPRVDGVTLLYVPEILQTRHRPVLQVGCRGLQHSRPGYVLVGVGCLQQGTGCRVTTAAKLHCLHCESLCIVGLHH